MKKCSQGTCSLWSDFAVQCWVSMEPVAAVGSGFTFGEATFVTCWHCVSGPLGDGEVYGAAMRSEGTSSQTYNQVFELADLEQDAAGNDSRSRGSATPSIPS